MANETYIHIEYFGDNFLSDMQHGCLTRRRCRTEKPTHIRSFTMGRAGWPSTTGNPSGGGRDNNPPRK